MTTYPKTHAMITFGTHESLKCIEALKPYNKNYCKYYGLDYYHVDIPVNDLYPKYVNTLNRAPHTLKFSVLLYFLDTIDKKYDYVWWCDSDIVMLNRFSIIDIVNSDADKFFPLYNIFTNTLCYNIHGGLYCLKNTPDNIKFLEHCAFDFKYSHYYLRSHYDPPGNVLDELIMQECNKLFNNTTQYMHVSKFMGQVDIDVEDIPSGASVYRASDGNYYVFSLNECPDYRSKEITCVHIFGKNKVKNTNKCIEVLDVNRCFSYSASL